MKKFTFEPCPTALSSDVETLAVAASLRMLRYALEGELAEC